MRSVFFLTFFAFAFIFTACGGKNSSTTAENDSLNIEQPDSATVANNEAKAALTTARPFLEKELNAWAKSFKGFHTNSLKQSQIGKFDMRESENLGEDIKDFLLLYEPSIAYSPDSSQFIDMYSSGISLDKKGKRIIAIGDVDQGVTLCNLKTKECIGLVYFGPSAAIEEAVWTFATQFILAGFMRNEEGKAAPILLLGDTNNKSLRWYEAGITRLGDYNSTSMQKLKIDEWE
jgi:hypothetical protein